MKIAIVSPVLATDFGNEAFYNVQSYGLSRSLAELGHSVRIFTVRKRGRMDEQALSTVRGEVIVEFLPRNLKLSHAPLMNPALLKKIRKGDFDVVQTSEDMSPTSVMLGLFKDSLDSRLVLYQGLYRRPSTSKGRVYFGIFDRILRGRMTTSVDGVIAKTNAAKEYMLSRGYRRVFAVPVGVDLDSFRPLDRLECRERLGFREEQKLVLYVGQLQEWRDVESCVKSIAASRAAVPEINLAVVGDGPSRDSLIATAKALKVSDRVHFLGPIPNRDLPSVYCAADITVLPMKRNALFTYGMTIAESLACGVPVISAPVPAALDHITDGFNGFIIPFEDHQAISDAISEILRSDEEYNELSRNAREFAVETLGWRFLAEEYARIYSG